MDYKEAVGYLFSYTDYEKQPMPHDPAFYDLRRVDELLARFGDPHRGTPSVHIAGTKGKGSVAAMVASVLTASGYVTGLYTSPHLHTWRERMRVDGELISEKDFVALMERLKPAVEEVNRKATYGELTTFELLTALGFAHFRQKGVDFQVLEVGMGGKFDATNVIQPEVCIITSISLDHTEVLGDTLAKIATEKAGIIKAGSVAVTSSQQGEAYEVIEKTCANRGVKLITVGTDITWESLGFDSSRQSLRVKGRLGSYELAIPLLGDYQLGNAATAVASLEVLTEKGFHISRESIISGLAKISWPGRFQVLGHQPLLVVDGAHNPDSAQKLRQSLEKYFKPEQAILVLGASSDKDIAGIVSQLAPVFDKVIVTRADHPRAMKLDILVAEYKKHGIEAQAAETVSEALSLARSLAGAKDLICVTGSLFIVGEAIEQINRHGNRSKVS